MAQTTTEPIPVTTRSLEELSFFPVYDAPATTISLNDARVSAEIGGLLMEIPVQAGDNVKAGDLVAKLDCQDHVYAAEQAQALLQAAQAEAEFARFQLERAQQLVKTRAVSTEMLNERQAQATKTRAEIDRLKVALRAAERRVKKCEIRAPFEAVVIERLASIGELMAPGSPIMRLLDREHLEVSGNIQEQDLISLQTAQAVRFVSGEDSYPLHVRTVIPFVETRIRSYEVRFSFVNLQAAPGKVGRLEWISHKRHIPSELLVRRGDKLGVFIEKEGRAHFQVIEKAQEGQPAVLDLPKDTSIIVDGRFGLMDGIPVQLVNNL